MRDEWSISACCCAGLYKVGIVTSSMLDREKVRHFVLRDLESLEETVKKISEEVGTGTTVSLPLDMYLRLEAIHIQVISKFEFLLKTLGAIKGHSGLESFIQGRSGLDEKEQEPLLYLLQIRHTVVHNGSFADKKFSDNVKKFKYLKINIPEDGQSLTLLPLPELIRGINNVKEIVEVTK